MNDENLTMEDKVVAEFKEKEMTPEEMEASESEEINPDEASQMIKQASLEVASLEFSGQELAQKIDEPDATKMFEEINAEAERSLSEFSSELHMSSEEPTYAETEVEKTSAHDLSEIIGNLREQLKNPEIKGLPKVAALGDGDKIENQQINYYLSSERVYVSFKLSADHFVKIQKKFENSGAEPDSIVRPVLSGKEVVGENEVCKALSIDNNGVKVKIFKKNNQLLKRIAATFLKMNPTMNEATNSLVNVEIPMSNEKEEMDYQVLSNQLDSVFSDLLEIPDALKKPDAKSENDYKLARYCWQHKKDKDNLTEDERNFAEEQLVREEVMPGYFTMVEKGKHKEYEAMSPYTLFHRFGPSESFLAPIDDAAVESLVNLIKGPGLYSRLERTQRGLHNKARSNFHPDMLSGGADSVFTRLITKEGTKNDTTKVSSGYTILFSQDLLDRTDWYAYRDDSFGSTAPFDLQSRHAPKDFLQKENKKHACGNEVMFRNGISVDKFKIIACNNEQMRSKLLTRLVENGITQVNGMPIESFVVVASTRKEWVEAATQQNK